MPVYYVGGTVPIAIALLMLVLVPESIGFLAIRNAGRLRLSRIVGRIAPDLPQLAGTTYSITEDRVAGVSIRNLFTDGRALMTICFWVVAFCCWLVLITLLAWMVPILREAGIPISKAPLMIAANSAGAVIGAPIIGRIMDKISPHSVIITGFLIGAVAVSALGLAITSVNLFAVCAFIAGFAFGGASAGLMALVAASYPTSIRATGVGWAIGVSRFGAVVGPVLAGIILSSGWSLHAFFGSMGALGLIATLFMVILLMNTQQSKPATALRGSAV
jgi:AAHS family 4-hydroxybenzoate transporter-like MFS transporter